MPNVSFIFKKIMLKVPNLTHLPSDMALTKQVLKQKNKLGSGNPLTCHMQGDNKIAYLNFLFKDISKIKKCNKKGPVSSNI